jgi:26S proteasome regulatory subunit N5
MTKLTDENEKMKFIQTLKDITEKKIFLEVEYARCCMLLVKYNESKTNDLQQAVKIMEKV